MKSPWKFLAQLTSRRRPAETPEGSIGHNAETMAIESEAQQTSVLPLNSAEDSGRPDHDENPAVDLVATPSNETASKLDARPPALLSVDVGELQAPAHDEVSQSSVEAPALAPENTTSKKPSRTPQTKRLARTRRPKTDMVSASPAVANSEQAAQSLSPTEIFFHKAVSLDEEIRQLRTNWLRN